jgi:ribonuclease Z
VRTLFHPFLPNGAGGDPLLWVDLLDERDSLLVDLGDLGAVPGRRLQRVGRAIVTHTHMDHFVGFDRLLRSALTRARELVVTGPGGFSSNVRGRLDGYTWNLIADYPIRLRAEEIDGDVVRSCLFRGENGLRAEPLPDRRFDGVIHAAGEWTLQAVTLDHGVPVLGVALCEIEHLAVNRDRLERRGLAPGPWLRELKQRTRRGTPAEEPLQVSRADGSLESIARGELTAELLLRAPGQKVVYLTDLRYTPENVERATSFAAGANLLVCEAAFLHADEALALRRNHLTARQAGELARAAGVERLAPFHFSPRYEGRERELLDEAAAAFGGPVVRLPTWPEPPAPGERVL